MKQFVKRKHMKSFGIIALLALCLSATATLAQRPFHIENSVVAAHQVSYLSWTSLGENCVYHIFRKYPGSAAYAPIAVLEQTQYYDTLGRTICADTVKYYIRAFSDTASSALISDTASLYHQDNLPTAPCALRLCSVDSATNKIRLTWYPSPDPDVMGYFILQGIPSRAYDTVWGRLSTTYLCPDDLSQGPEQYHFRILAFDSCFQASPLTPYYHNPVLTFAQSPCSRHFHCSWNRYINMPDSVGGYTLHYQIAGQEEQLFRTGPDGPFDFDITVDDLAVDRITVYLSVDNSSDSLHALSLKKVFQFPSIDSAAYIRIADAEYLETTAAVRLKIQLDPTFTGSPLQILRRQGSRGEFQPLAELPLSSLTAEYEYLDTQVHPAAGAYTYQLSVRDSCQLLTQFSDTLRVQLPEVYDPAAYLPNAVIYGHPQLGTFCPSILSPLADGYQMSIYNRYGERVFNTTSIADCWFGNDAAGRPLEQGTYVYIINCRHADGSTRKYKGTAILIK